jgi:uncharacterized DUF497 family protein
VTELKFEWDQNKAAQNLAKHGVSFLTAAAIFANEIVEESTIGKTTAKPDSSRLVARTWRFIP